MTGQRSDHTRINTIGRGRRHRRKIVCYNVNLLRKTTMKSDKKNASTCILEQLITARFTTLAKF